MVQRKVDYKPFAPHNDSNLVSQETWENASTVDMGFVEGKASAKMVNKALRQATSISASFAEMIAKYADVDVLDDGNTLKLAEDFKTAIFNIAQMTMQENVLDLKYSKRIMMDSYVNYKNIVILLCKVSPEPTDPDNGGKGYASIAGKLSFFRGGVGSAVRLEQLNIAVHTAYRSSTFNEVNKLAMSHESTSWDFRFATCMYGGEKWLVLRNKSPNAQNFLGDFTGISRFIDPKEKENFLKVVPYAEIPHDGQPEKVLDGEIYNSLTEVPAGNIQKMTDAVGGEYYTSANKPTPSDLGAMYKELPLPDFHAPLNDDLKILHGFGDYDTITINDHVIDLATKSLNYLRTGVGSYFNKSGLLCYAEENEPRFEKYGLLFEPSSVNTWTYQTLDAMPGKSNAAVFTTTLPDGAIGDTIRLTPVSGQFSYVRAFGITGKTGKHWLSCFAKYEDGSGGIPPLFTGSNGAFGLRFSGIPLYNGWWWMYRSVDDPSGNIGFGWAPSLPNNEAFPTKNVLVCNFQMEKNEQPTSFIPIVNGRETARGPDKLEVTGIGNWNHTFTFSAEVHVAWDAMPNPAPRIFDLGLAYGGGSMDTSYRSVQIHSNQILFQFGSSGSNNLTVPRDSAIERNIVVASFNKDTKEAKLCVNGTISKRSNDNTISSVKIPNTIRFGGQSDNDGARSVHGHLRNIKFWHQDFTEEQLKWIR